MGLRVHAPDRSIPREILSDLLRYEKEAYVNLRVGRYGKAGELYRRELNLIADWQEKENRPIHKATPLYMTGICLFYLQRIVKALRFFLLAYVEDTLNVGVGFESEADLAPAGLILRNILLQMPEAASFMQRTWDGIKVHVAQLKRTKKWAQARDPEKILIDVLSITYEHIPLDIGPWKPIGDGRRLPKISPVPSTSILRQLGIVSKKPIDPLPGTWDKRVFVGGDYDHLGILRDIKEAVTKSGFVPILPFEFLVPTKLIHHHDLMLLHCCRLGIFEVSSPAGQLMEVERAKDYGVRTILLYTDRDGPPHSLTTMVQTAGYDMMPYGDSSDLKQKVKNWLARF